MNKKLKAKIIESFGTQSDFADACKIRESQISRVIHGREELDPEDQRWWARLLKCKVEDIFK
jgi:transcriptional regulator with XRE-family HTH domain